MRALITGGAGFIGSHLADAILAGGGQVTILDSLNPQVHPQGQPVWLPDAARFHHGSVNSPQDLERALDGVDIVFHLAAETGTGQSMYEVARHVETNVGGTARLIEALAARGGAPRVVLSSSRAIYGEGAGNCEVCGPVAPLSSRTLLDMERGEWAAACGSCGRPAEPRPTPEDAPPCPGSIYGVTKHAQEELLRVAAEAGTIDGWALRFQNVFGPRQSLANPYTGILGVFFGRLSRGAPCELFEDGEVSRDFVYVGDAVEALLAAMRRPAGGFVAVNIGSGTRTSVRTVNDEMARLLGRGDSIPPRVSGRCRAGDIRHACADLSLARERLDWCPTTSFGLGLEKFVSWAGESALPEDQSEAAHEELRRRGLAR